MRRKHRFALRESRFRVVEWVISRCEMNPFATMRKLSYTARIHLPSSKTYQHIIQTLSFTSRFSTEKVRSMAQLNKPHGQINLSMQQLSQRLLLLFMDYGGKKTKAARQSCNCRNTFLPLRSKKGHAADEDDNKMQ